MRPHIEYATIDHLAEVPSDDAQKVRTLNIVAAHEDPERVLRESCRSVLIGPRVLGVFGVWPMWSGVGRAWTLLSPELLLRFPKLLHRTVRSELAEFIDKNQLRRVEAIVLAEHEAGNRWIRRLGFEHEGLLRSYGMNGEDCHIYARYASWT